MAKNQIIYYFGAGASIQAIPSVDGLRHRFSEIVSYLDQFNEHRKNPDHFRQSIPDSIRSNQASLRQIIQDLNWLNQESENHQTVDTLAKKLYLQEDIPNLNKLKRALLSYFFLEQSIRIKGTDDQGSTVFDRLLDKRYDNLIAGLAYRGDGRIKLKGNVKFITWNYDLQIDYAIQNFVRKESLNKVKEEFNIHPNMNSFNVTKGDVINSADFATIKLNGNAFLDPTLIKGKGGGITPYDYEKPNTTRSDGSIFADYLEQFQEAFPDGEVGSPDIFNYFNFAWEEHDRYTGFQNLIENTKNVLRETRTLVIVGYSFPFFNSYIDKQLLSECIPDEIVIQDKHPETIKTRLLDLVPKFGHTDNTAYKDLKFTLLEPDKYFPIPSFLGS